ncbi:MAG: response regulator [Acidobacteria bacterium]|nr:MAG: response regulator [Acidobacteriota bacterium]
MEEAVKVLIVDDERDVCFLLSTILKHRNMHSICVNSIDEARSELVRDNPAIIFLDNHLPDGFGIHFIDEIRAIRPNTKIVMITAYDTNNDKEKAHLAGVDFFIGKPFTRDNIFSAVESLVKLKV